MRSNLENFTDFVHLSKHNSRFVVLTRPDTSREGDWDVALEAKPYPFKSNGKVCVGFKLRRGGGFTHVCLIAGTKGSRELVDLTMDNLEEMTTGGHGEDEPA